MIDDLNIITNYIKDILGLKENKPLHQNTILQPNHTRILYVNESNEIIFPQTSTFAGTKNIQNKENVIRKSKLLLQKEQFKAHHHTCTTLKTSLNVDTNSTNFAPSTILPQTTTKSNKEKTIRSKIHIPSSSITL